MTGIRWSGIRWPGTARSGIRRSGLRESGEPVHGGSAFHVWWGHLPDEPIKEVAATLEVVEMPTVSRLYFWALQASFRDAVRGWGAAHTGLQWNPRHPDNLAVNWGGYHDAADGGAVLDGTMSPLPGIPGDVNTRNYPWRPGRPYRFRIRRGDRGWLATMDDPDTGTSIPLRQLDAPGDRLASPVVWAEVFCSCDHPRTVVRWSAFEVVTFGGTVARPGSVRLNFPPHEQGDCENTDIVVDGDSVLLVTRTRRTARTGAVLPLG